MVETAIVLGLSGASAFISLVAWRMKIAAESAVVRDKNPLLFRYSEIGLWCMAALFVDILLFTVLEIGSAVSYVGALRAVFIIFQVLIGLVAGVGVIFASFALLAMLFGSFFKKKK